MVLTEEQLQKFDDEIKQRGMGINPANAFQDEADSYSYTPEATVPEQEVTEQSVKSVDIPQSDYQSGNVDLIGTDEIQTSSMAMPVAESIVKFTTYAADNIKKTNIYKRATYTKDDVLREAKEINIETGIPINSILYNAETLDNARNIYNYRRKQMELMMPGENEVSVNGLMEAYPGLDKIINSGNEIDGAIALQNIKNVKQINNIFEAIKAKGQAGWIGYKMGEIGAKPIREGRGITEEEFAKYDEYVKQINDMKQLPTFYEDPFMNIVGSTAEQLPRQISGSVTGVLYGTAAAATAAGATALTAPLTGGTSLAAVPVAAKTGFRWGMRAGYVVDMFENSAGQRYIEYSRMKDENGKRVLNDEEARAYAVVMGAIEAGIEFANFDLVLGALKGNKSAVANQIRNAVSGAVDAASLRKSLGGMLKNAGMITLSESVEEGVTEAADRVGSTIVSNLKNTTAIPRYTPGQVAEGFFEKTVEAIPASMGFAGLAVGSSSFGFVRRAAAFAEWKDNNVREQLKNQSGISMMKDMAESADIKTFFKKDPDVAQQVLKNTVAGTGYEKVNIDTEMVARQENGLAALRDIGERAGMSVEEIQTAIETGADLTVPTEVYFQMRAENENFAINDDFIAFSDVAPSYARNKYYAEMKKAEIDAIMNDANTRQLEQQMAAIDMIVQDNFAEGIERDAAAAVLTMRPDNPIEGLKEMRGMYKEQLDSILAPVIRDLEKGMKQGVDIVRVEGDRDARYERVSNNAEWAREFYKENKRWPTKFELEGMAIDILSGRDFSKLADYQNVPEMQEYYEANAAQIDELLGNIEAFDNIEERIANIDADELQTMEGMSREAYDIYKRESANAIANAPNDAVKRAAKMGAALLAYRADRFAEAKRAAGETNYTAKDYYDRTLQIKYGGTFAKPQNEQYFQVSAEEFNRQKEAVRSRYENTDQWMKAPNGEDTNLTEDQWVTVRTDAFKNWFGDWENNPENASQVLDENGEPLMVFHGTVSGEFDTFDRSYSSIEGDMGAGFYFTNNRSDVEANYEDGGPDFENKVSRRAEQIEAEGDVDFDEAREQAREELYKESALYKTFLNIRNPAYVHSTMLFEDVELEDDINEEDYESEEEYYEARDNAVQDAWSDKIYDITGRVEAEDLMSDASALSDALWEVIYDGGMTIPQLKEKLNDLYPETSEGEWSANEILRIVVDELGYDGIVDTTVSQKFKGMRLDPDTTHYIAFEPNQIKDASGRNVGFDPNSENIYYQKENERNNKILERQKAEVRLQYQDTDDWLKAPNGKDTNLTEDQWVTVRTRLFKRWFGNWETNPANASKLLDENGEPRVFYHGTGAEFDTFDISYLGAASGDAGWFGKGFYFAFSENEAKMYDDRRIVAAFLNMRNPFDFQENMTTYNGYDSNLYGTSDLAFILNLVDKFPELAKNQNVEVSDEGFIEKISFEELANAAKDVMENIEFKVEENTNEDTGEKEYLLLGDLQEDKFTDSEGNERTSKYYNFQRKFTTKKDAENKLNQAYLYLKESVYDGYMNIPRFPRVVQEIDLKEALIENGYDGVIQSKYGDEAVAFASNQIKDATGRNVGFDPESGNIYFQTAYHGTGARFDRFSTDFVGTGEGMQYYGWGLYFSKNRDVAEEYRKRFTPADVIVSFDGKVPKSKQKLADELSRMLQTEVLRGSTIEEAVQKRIDFHKQNLQFYENNPKQATKSKIKKEQDKIDFLNANKDKFKSEQQGQVFEADIPDDDVLLDRDKGYEEQPDAVKNGLQNVWKELSIEKPLDGLSGQGIYAEISRALGGDKEASLKLNENGIKGIKYTGSRDGQSFVVFDDKAIDILNKFYQRQQRQGDVIQGATEFEETGRRIISIFESGNESTMAHELGHVFVADLKELAEMPNAPEQIKKDWQTIKDWLGYKDSQKTFTTAQQEKFARGFEAYLRTGEAPATGLRKIFRQFKNWLTKIYKDFMSLGGKPSAEVQAVMARMLATEEEVENAFKLREAETFEKAGGFDYLAKDSLEMYKRWQKDAQEYAKEKVLKEAMKNLTEQRAKELEAVREKMTDDIRTQLLSTPVYRAEMILSANPKLANDWPAEQFGMTYEEYTEAIKTQGTLEEATNKAVDVAMQEVEEGLPLEEIKRDAENAVNTSEYRGMYLAFEQDFIQKKMRRDETLSRQIEQTLADIERETSGIGEEVAEDSAEVKRLKQRIKELKYRARWTEAELKTLNRLERANNKEERMAAIKAVKEMLRNARKNVKVYRDNAVTNYKYIKEYAKENMAEMSVDDATNVAKWTALEKRAGRESVEALKRALDSELRDTKVNDEKVTDAWKEANDAKFRQRVFAEYAALATKNKAKVQRKNARLQARQKTIERNNNIPANERYMYVHGLYVLGLSKTDAQMPQGEPSILGMFQEYSDNLQAFFVDEDGKVNLPDYILSAFSGNAVYNDGYANLTMDQYNDFVDVLTAIYKAGIDANKVKSMKDANGNTVLISDVAESIVAEMNARIPAIVRDDITNAGSMTFKEYIQDKARRARISLTKPEEILDWMGPTAHRYIYETVNQSWNKEKVMQEQVAVAVKAIWAPYTNTEKSEMRSKRQFRFGTSILTREEMICVAFNWGTEINRRRIMDGFNVDESTVRELLSNMTQKDWQMVTSVWDLVNSYWPETVRVEESMVGVAPEKQSAMPFEIVGKDGNVYKLNGGYYPIIYDPNKSLAAANQAQEDVAKQVAGGNAAMNRNRGHLKQRTKQKVTRPVMLSFNVLNKHLSNVVHNICFRESLRDVNRIIKNQAVSQAIEDHFGIPQARAFRKWVEDCWAPDVQNKGIASSALEFFRHKQTAAALGYRATTAMLNSLNIFPITDYLGPARTIDALQKFYNSPKENWNFALDRSVFLRERAETMDRDAGEVLRKEFIGGYGKVADTLIRGERAIEAHAFDILAVTDLALACPLWLSEYQRVYQANNKNLAEMDEDAIARLEMEAVAAGDKAVRKIFGSGEMKDLAPIQKGDEMTKAVSMFYSYFNVVFNALYGGYAQGRREAMTEGATKVLGQSLGFRVAPLVQKLVFWTVFTGVFEGLQRNAIDVLAGGSDDPEEWLKKMFKGVTDNVFGTIPVVRDIASMIVDKLMGERYYGAKPLPAYQLVDTAMRFWNTVESKKKTKIDVFREGMRITNGFTGIGNTLTDAMATTAYWVDTDFDKPLLEYLSAVIFDKRIDKKRKK